MELTIVVRLVCLYLLDDGRHSEPIVPQTEDGVNPAIHRCMWLNVVRFSFGLLSLCPFADHDR
jgi:hypothetical protein